MKTRFLSLTQSPDASEGALANSGYSTERSPITALLFEGKRKIALPAIMPAENLPGVESLPEASRSADLQSAFRAAESTAKAQHKVECSFQEQ